MEELDPDALRIHAKTPTGIVMSERLETPAVDSADSEEHSDHESSLLPQRMLSQCMLSRCHVTAHYQDDGSTYEEAMQETLARDVENFIGHRGSRLRKKQETVKNR
ncbi:hypothetical protein COOONC_28160 [Cooperia oncophora]